MYNIKKKKILYIIQPRFHHSYSQFIYQVSDEISILSTSRNNLDRCLYSLPDVAAHCHAGELNRLWAVCCLWNNIIDLQSYLHTNYRCQLVSSKFGLSQILSSTVLRWVHSQISPCLLCYHLSPPNPRDQMYPSQLHQWLSLEQVYGKYRSGWEQQSILSHLHSVCWAIIEERQ